MGRAKKFEVDMDMFLDLPEGEIKDSIIRSVKQISKSKKDLKEYSEAVKDVIKEQEARIEAGLEALAGLENKAAAA